jgi:hypothetical protein
MLRKARESIGESHAAFERQEHNNRIAQNPKAESRPIDVYRLTRFESITTAIILHAARVEF